MSLVSCRYNTNHKMKTSRLLIHEDSCPDRIGKMLKVCPFNPVHKVSPNNYESHKKACPQRPIVDQNLEKEMKEHIRKLKEEKISGNKLKQGDKSKTQSKEEHSSSLVKKYDIVENEVIGMKSKKEKEFQINEKKRKQKEMLHLIENSNFEESDVIDSFNSKLQSKEYPNNFEINESEFAFTIDNHNFEITESEYDNINAIINKDSNIDADLDVDYDPNVSDLDINRHNNNHIEGFSELKEEEDMSLSYMGSSV
jgi:hypothetical protein